MMHVLLDLVLFVSHFYLYIYLVFYSSQDQAMIDKITYTTHSFVARGLLERDRHLFSLLLAIEVSLQF